MGLICLTMQVKSCSANNASYPVPLHCLLNWKCKEEKINKNMTQEKSQMYFIIYYYYFVWTC